MIVSVFSVFLIKVRDLLVFIGICLYIHVIDNLFDNLLIALFDLYLPLANILLLWHVISN